MTLASFAIFRSSAWAPVPAIVSNGISGGSVRASVGVPATSTIILYTSSATQSHGFSGGIIQALFMVSNFSSSTNTFAVGLSFLQDRDDVTSQGETYAVEAAPVQGVLRIRKFSAGLASTGQQSAIKEVAFSFTQHTPYALQARWHVDLQELRGVYLEGRIKQGITFDNFTTAVCAIDEKAPLSSAVNEGAFGRNLAAGSPWILLVDDVQLYRASAA